MAEAEGCFTFTGLGQRSYTLEVSYLDYRKCILTIQPTCMGSGLP